MKLLPPPTCECCGRSWPHVRVSMENSRTNYYRPPTPHERICQEVMWRLTHDTDMPVYYTEFYDEVANRDLSLCSECAAVHHADWDDAWASYYNGLV